MIARFGMLVMMLGISMADSDKLWIPVAVIAIGALLIKIGLKSDE